jgi:hypothetical protein
MMCKGSEDRKEPQYPTSEMEAKDVLKIQLGEWFC